MESLCLKNSLMSGNLEGYSYDIFISYRQNDNKYDGWVTEFVNNLRRELEATIKEKLTIFFDENPADGLLETHSVDHSLSEKIKCLIFIPVISQTYCDVNSYAWQHEFLVFNKFAAEDRFGKNIKLLNNNVASRILPVKIHDIDPEDRSLLERELGGKLRSIDFIYRSPGVNRPLRPYEDHPGNNLNKTYYRDQINKIANAVKEIITALKRQSIAEVQVSTLVPVHDHTGYKSRIGVIGGVATLILTVMAIFWFSGGIRSPGSVEKSIAVLPFRNDSPNDSNTYFINGIMEEVLNNLQKIKDVRIISRTSVEQYRNSPKSIPQIGRELGVNYIVEGSGQRYGNSFKVNVNLIKARKEDFLWGKQYEQMINLPGDIVNIQSTIAQSIVTELKGTITPEEKQLIEKIPTTNLTAYDFYQKGKDELTKFWVDPSNQQPLALAEKLFLKALQEDPSFAGALAGRAEVYWNYRSFMNREDVLDSVLLFADLALSYDDKLPEAYVIKGLCYDDAGMSDRSLEQYKKAIELSPNNWKAYFGLADLYDFEDPVKSFYNLHKAVSLTRGAAEMPSLLRHIGGQLLVTGHIEKARDYFTRAFELDGDSAIYLSCLGGIEHNLGNYEKAIEIYSQSFNMKNNYNEVIHNLAVFTQLLGRNKESLKYYRELESRGDVGFNMHRMAYALWVNGFREEGNAYFDKYIAICNNTLETGRRPDIIAYTYFDLAGIYAFRGEREKAYQYLRDFTRSENSFLFMVTLLKNDPLLNNIKQEPAFKNIVQAMEVKYEHVHEDVGEWLEKQEGF
jgi:TolB-like protein/Tfp pilus assembly protein PilF